MHTNGFTTFKVLMIKIPAICVLLLLFGIQLQAQFGNEWIDYGQQYVRIPVAQNGLYRVPFSSIESAGLTISDPARLQLFHRGSEHSIIVASDYIEFYGERNDGTLDKKLYDQESFQPHRYYNLFSDTTSYFLTIGQAVGKRVSSYSDANASLNPETFFYAEKLLLFTGSYAQGRDYGDVIKTSFDQGEGWMGTGIREGQTRYDTIKGVVRTFAAGAKPILEIVLTGRAYMNHGVDVYIGSSSRLLTSVTVNGFETRKLTHQIEWSDIDPAGTLRIGVSVNAINTSSAEVSVNYFKLTYSEESDAANHSAYFFKIPENPQNTSYIELKNSPDDTRLFDITDAKNPVLIGTNRTTTLNAMIRETSIPRSLLATATFIEPVVKRVTFTEINPLDHDYIIISHSLLRKPGGGYSDPVLAYSEYRASEAGGSHSPLLMNIDQVFDQFAYGEQSPVGIFQLMKFLSSVKIPDYLFLIGKGLDPDYDYFRKPGLAVDFKSLVPGAGMPASDMAFSAGLGGAQHVPAIATGRITAMHPEEVSAYLNKVIEAEARPFNDLRRKNLLHLSGGVFAGEAQRFRGYLQEFGNTAKGFYLGGQVSAIAKESTDIKLINISKEVNQGLSLVTFFGHSSAVTLDFDVGKVTDDVMGYKNKGKYPVMLMNGCQAGAFFRYFELFGENWINAPDRGAVGFIAHSSLGLAGLLRRYTDLFYAVGFADSVFIQKGLGDIQNEVARRYLISHGNSSADVAQAQQMMLLGDPAVRLFGAADPDYAVADEHVSIRTLNGRPVTVASDSFAINFVVKNYGSSTNKPLHVEVRRTLSDQSMIVYDSIYSPLLYADTLLFIVRGRIENGGGHNSFEIRVDGNQIIGELREDNNSAYIDYFIPENGTKNLYPSDFSIVNRTDLSLSFQHTDLLSDVREFLVEIDTTNAFDSPYRKTFSISGKVLVRQSVQLLAADSMVYYWRTKIAIPEGNESTAWSGSSFTYIDNGPEGWMQSHFPQYMDNTFTGIIPDSVDREFRFEVTRTPLFIRTFGADAGQTVQDVSITIDSVEYNLFAQGFGCRNNTINLIAFDRHSTSPYQGVRFQWFNSGGRGCGREPWVINSFSYNEMVTGNNDDIIKYVDNIPAGDSVVIFNIGNANYELWPEAAKMKLGELGVSLSQINELVTGEPVVIFGRKGLSPGSARITRVSGGSPASEELEVPGSITGGNTSGEMKTPMIGPALAWHELDFVTEDVEGADVPMVDIYGIGQNGHLQLLFDSIESAFDLSSIDAVQYPYLKLAYRISDDVNLTPSMLDRWIVRYEAAPEGLIFFRDPVEEVAIQEGIRWDGAYGFINVSDQEFSGPLIVNYKLINTSSSTTSEYTVSIDPPPAGDTTLFVVPLETYQKTGIHNVEVFVNPYVAAEQYYDNNFIMLNDHLRVFGEPFNPVIDVTFDGRYISKNEYVTKEPRIVITLWDENKILLKDDTTGVDIFLASPCDLEPCAFTRINFTSENVQWYPATDTSNFRVIFNPGLNPGVHTLRVNGYDQSGNSTGEDPYEISFQVAGEHLIEISELFPNPVYDEVRLQLVLTERTVSDQVDIEMIALTGKHFRSFTIPASELHVGNNTLVLNLNKGEVAAGIYIYKLTVRSNGRTIEKKGKLVIVY